MAKFKYSQILEGTFEGSLDLKVKKQGTVAVWTDDTSGAQIKLEGKNFEVSSEDEDYLSAGKINTVEITNGDKKDVLEITGLNLKATKVMDAFNEGGQLGVLYYITKGDDEIIGSKKADQLIGGAGNDTMTGGKGSDYFDFHTAVVWEPRGKATAEADVIKDFDTTGDDHDTLNMSLNMEWSYKKIHQNQDTLVTWDDGSTLLLEGVTKAEFKTYIETYMV